MIASRNIMSEAPTLYMPSVTIRRGTERLKTMLQPLLAKEAVTPQALKPWCTLSADEQNSLVAHCLMGWKTTNGTPPKYAERMDLAVMLINITARVAWRYEQFAKILGECLAKRLHLDPRAQLHPSQIYTALNPTDVAYAFVVVFGGQQGQEIVWE